MHFKVNHPPRSWLRAIAAVMLLVGVFLASGTAWAAPPPVKDTPGLTVRLLHSQYGKGSQGTDQPAAVSPASDIYCLGVTLNVTNNSSAHTVEIKLGVNNISCGADVTDLEWEYFSTITCGGTESGDPSNQGFRQVLSKGQFATVADDNWFVACYNGLGFPVPYNIVVTAQAEGNIVGNPNLAFGQQNFGGVFS